ncbi:TerC family protein [Gottfriedia solisilvae]|uniref:Membrane protein n=1 Tax=Gottfriedia solisilvae TaxID=1516104 RepID=A0A8J3ADX1_9BACI|nr:TerC family protein [Gottfriedia solisilvae]GGI12084.1 membrane protein [Gottfriedia solisilvae]
MEIFGLSLGVLVNVIFIDLLLSGDNAILIALAAKNLPEDQKKKAVLLGTAGAIGLRVIFAAIVVYLLEIPLIYAIGGLMLLWIAFKLLVDDAGHGDVKSGATLWGAIKTIIVADALMSLDNVLALAGVAHGDLTAIVIGILISIPLIVWGSSFLMKVMNKYPIITTIGSAILAWTAAGMITHDNMIKDVFENEMIATTFKVVLTAVVVIAGTLVAKKKAQKHNESSSQNQTA